MKRLAIAFVAALALGLGAALPSHAQAPKEPAPAAKSKPTAVKPDAKAPVKKAASTKLAPGQKQCRSKLPDGSVKTWTCGKDQPCCVSHSFNLYTCGSQLLKCF